MLRAKRSPETRAKLSEAKKAYWAAKRQAHPVVEGEGG
jgi:hypothetical protein